MKFQRKHKYEKKAANNDNPADIAAEASGTEQGQAAEQPAEAAAAAQNEDAASARAEAKVAELEEQHLRLRAEFANYKRRAEKERNDLASYVKASVYREILPTLDDFERFFLHVEDRKDGLDQDFVQGIEMIHKSLVSVLQRQGIERVQETGVPFDPHLHEAMLTGKVEDEAADHTVLQVLEAGYRMGEVVIRPARVKVGIYEKV